MGWPDLLSKRRGVDEYGDEHDEFGEDNLYESTNSLARSLMPMQQISTMYDIRNSTHLRT